MTLPHVVHRIDFASPPEAGIILLREGQRYELAEIRPHVRRDGRPTWLLVWKSHCTDCDAVFDVVTGLTAAVSSLNRRCPAHHDPGRAVTVAGAKRRSRFLHRVSARKQRS